MKSLKTSPGQRQQRRSRGPLLLGLLIVGIIAAIAIPLYLGFSQMMGGSASQVASASPGAHIKEAVEVIEMPSQALLNGTLLQKNSDGTYSHAGKAVSIKWDAAKVVMGSSSQVKVGAVLQVDGILGSDGILSSTQIVILTGFVHLK
ncbi:MAG: hypothetical protein H0V70_04080 [Ktedonobacteraceae bacterium]|nr:hypothetical protein [Ktedonobacteraceae bacterium]